jgi:hypothetical protein
MPKIVVWFVRQLHQLGVDRRGRNAGSDRRGNGVLDHLFIVLRAEPTRSHNNASASALR